MIKTNIYNMNRLQTENQRLNKTPSIHSILSSHIAPP